MMYLPTEHYVLLAMAAAADGCAPDCWHCRAWANIHDTRFPFAQVLAASSPSVVGPPSMAAGGDTGGAVGGPLGEVRLAATPPTSEFGPGRVLRLLLGGRP